MIRSYLSRLVAGLVILCVLAPTQPVEARRAAAAPAKALDPVDHWLLQLRTEIDRVRQYVRTYAPIGNGLPGSDEEVIKHLKILFLELKMGNDPRVTDDDADSVHGNLMYINQQMRTGRYRKCSLFMKSMIPRLINVVFQLKYALKGRR